MHTEEKEEQERWCEGESREEAVQPSTAKLDLVYCNVKNAFLSIQRPKVGRSDHNAVQLLPKYQHKLKTQSVQKRVVKVWDKAGIEQLQGCFACTDWQVLVDGEEDVDKITDTVTSYVKFCEDVCLEKKESCVPESKTMGHQRGESRSEEQKHREREKRTEEGYCKKQKRLSLV